MLLIWSLRALDFSSQPPLGTHFLMGSSKAKLKFVAALAIPWSEIVFRPAIMLNSCMATFYTILAIIVLYNMAKAGQDLATLYKWALLKLYIYKLQTSSLPPNVEFIFGACNVCQLANNACTEDNQNCWQQVQRPQLKGRSLIIYLTFSPRKVKACLQKIRLREAERMSVREGVHMEVLIDKFSESCPFRPLDMFDVNFSTAASLAGTQFSGKNLGENVAWFFAWNIKQLKLFLS